MSALSPRAKKTPFFSLVMKELQALIGDKKNTPVRLPFPKGKGRLKKNLVGSSIPVQYAGCVNFR